MSLLDGVLGLRGWRWLFFVDGAPAILLGLFAMLLLTDRPENAKFLTDTRKSWLLTISRPIVARGPPAFRQPSWSRFAVHGSG